MVLYEFETSSLTLSEEHRLWVLKRIFGPKRYGMAGGWRKRHNEELHNLYFSPSIIRITKSRRMRLAEHVAYMGKQEGKTPLGRPRRTWVDNNKIDLRDIGWGGID
jgi:hypothetical protein